MSHWYAKDGSPQHFIDKTDGSGTRDTTLRDARKHSWRPSVTTIIDILAKPGLNNWLQTQIAIAAKNNPIEKDESVNDWVTRIKRIAREESEAARVKGGEIHKDIETLFKFESVEDSDLSYGEISVPAYHSINAYCKEDNNLIPEQTVVGDGYGGAIDLYNDEYILDVKTKDISDSDWFKYEDHVADPDKKKPPKLAYPEMCMQLSAYDRALGYKPQPSERQGIDGIPRRLINVFVDREIPGRVIFYEWEENMYKRFKHLVDYWQDEKNYYPGRNND